LGCNWWLSKMKLTLAQYYAIKYHQGQYRKDDFTPYIVHPEAVVGYLEKFGFEDELTLSVAWLHDTVEDTTLSQEEVRQVFGDDIAEGVYLLTRNVDREEYKQRLGLAPDNIKLVKLCDTLHNITSLECLSKKGIERKIDDCINFYIPMAQELCPEVANEMKGYLRNYLMALDN
jgi:GTP diphosphokinase / guanosine-3',5'-bis(diphosphate) 3'-diphosphatase